MDRTSRFADGEIDSDMMEFESDQFQAVGHSWKMIIEVKDAQSEDPELCFYLRLCNPSSRNTFYNKVIFDKASVT